MGQSDGRRPQVKKVDDDPDGGVNKWDPLFPIEAVSQGLNPRFQLLDPFDKLVSVRDLVWGIISRIPTRFREGVGVRWVEAQFLCLEPGQLFFGLF
jgi:hypothetical protein